MKDRIKLLKKHLAHLEDILADATGKPHPKIAGEIINARFELKQLLAQAALLNLPVK